MVNLKLSENTLYWRCPDNSGIAIYNGYDGNTVFLSSKHEVIEQGDDQSQVTFQVSSSLIDQFTSANIGSILAVNEFESDRILNQLISWGIFIGSDD